MLDNYVVLLWRASSQTENQVQTALLLDVVV